MPISDHWLLEVISWLVITRVFHEASQFWTSRKERFAAKIEYDDEGTTEHRKVELLCRYGTSIVIPPSHRFQNAAKQLIAEDTKQVRLVIGFYVVVALVLCIGSLVCKAIF